MWKIIQILYNDWLDCEDGDEKYEELRHFHDEDLWSKNERGIDFKVGNINIHLLWICQKCNYSSKSIEYFLKKDPKLSDYYVKIDIIGKGGFGKVIKAREKNNNEYRTIKIIINNQEINELENEVNIMKKMTNDNSIKIYEQFISDEEYSIIMELCDCDLKKI